MTDTVYYAIGDVHGEAERLGALHEAIRVDAKALGLKAVVVHLGDLVDRGPDSHGAVQRVIDLEAQANENFSVLTLRGNHEQMLLDALHSRDQRDLHHWLGNGGNHALESYLRAAGRQPDDWRDAIDKAHVDWMRRLRTLYRDDARRIAFVHAGIDPKTYPQCPDEIRIWTRSDRFFETTRWPRRPELENLLVVHGHTPTYNMLPHVMSRRINVDTGACFGGPLTCVVLAPRAEPRFIKA